MCSSDLRRVYEELRVTASLKTMLPRQIAAVEEAVALLGDDWWPYGVDANRATIDTFLRYHHEQGFTARLHSADAFFARELRNS